MVGNGNNAIANTGFFCKSANNQQPSEGAMFETSSYGPIVKALVEAHHIPREALGAFRGRLGALQKQGLLGPKNRPGKGVALRYTPDSLHRMVFACEMLEFGVAPSTVLSIVRDLWEPRLRKIFEAAEAAIAPKAGDPEDAWSKDIILHMGGIHLMVDGWLDAVPNVNSCPLHKLADQMKMWMSMRPDDPSGLPPRVIVTNLSMRLRAFHDAFAKSYLEDALAERRAVPAGKSKRKVQRSKQKRK